MCEQSIIHIKYVVHLDSLNGSYLLVFIHNKCVSIFIGFNEVASTEWLDNAQYIMAIVSEKNTNFSAQEYLDIQ